MGAQFDLFEMGRRARQRELELTKKARDRALAIVAARSDTWMSRAVDWYRNNIPSDWMGTGEDLRRHISPVIGQPHHPNAWGALIKFLIRNKVVEPTGRYLQMRDEKSHARKTPEYRRTQR